MATALVAYYRVSTQEQGRSGLGLEGQRQAVQDYARRIGIPIAREYTEIESGKRSDRPELIKALAHARRCQGQICVAKLDRLSRNVAFLSALMESGCDFVACDNPTANRLTVHILIAVAEDEARRISERTKSALAAYKARGGLLGSARPECRRNLTVDAAIKGRQLGVECLKKKADEAYTDLYDLVFVLRKSGQSLQAIASHLNQEGYVTRKGKSWNKWQVSLVLVRAERLLS